MFFDLDGLAYNVPPVDPECGLNESVHVYSSIINDRQMYYSVVLGLVYNEQNKNSYHRMQLLQSNENL